MSPSFLQLQTQAGHRAQSMPSPTMSSIKSNSDDSIQTLSSSSSSDAVPTAFDAVRCSRCRRSLSIDASASTKASGAIRFGVNSYYCSRCANLVGFIK